MKLTLVSIVLFGRTFFRFVETPVNGKVDKTVIDELLEEARLTFRIPRANLDGITFSIG